ncbi:hypothetical protein FOL47_009992, partial [Perkinsus chesapeaki]
YRTEQQLIAAMEPQKEIGLFRVDAEAFQRILKPNPVKCLEKLQRYIPEMAMARIHDLSEQLKEANERLGHLPTNVEEFVHFTTYLGNLAGTSGKGGEGVRKDTKEVDEQASAAGAMVPVEEGMAVDESISLQVMEGRQQDVADLMDLVKEFNIKITTKQRTAFMELSQTLSSLRNQIEFSQENTEANINRFIKELDQEIPCMLDCVTKGFDKLKDAQLSDESLASFKEGREGVLATLDQIDAHVEAVLKDSKRINDYQEALKVEVTPFEKVDELKVLFNSVSRMWRSLEEWEQTSEEWLQWRFGLVDVDKISKEVAVYQKVAMQSVKQLETNAVAVGFTRKVTAFKNTLPVVMALRNSALKERHWTEIHEIIGVELDLESDELTLGALLGMGVDKSMEQIQEISGRAGAEQSLEEMLDKVKRVWEDLELVVNPYKDSKEVFILGSVDDVITALEDSLVNISTISGSRFVGPIRDEVEEWQKNLMLFQETLDEWLAVQRNWVFGTDDDDKNAGGGASSAGAGAADIVGMISSEGEEIPFFKVLKARGNVEKWLLEVEEYMVKSMHAVMKKGFIDYPEQPRKEWVAEKEAQVVSCVGMIMWCAETERILQGKDKEKVVDSMRIWYQRNVTQLEELTDLVRSKLSSIQRRSVVALVTQDVHNRDIIEDLAESNVVSTSSFKWQQQLRYYWDAEEDDCIVNQVDAVIRYGYEYQGATTRLVITPLTDRCWMTITGALHIKLGAAPAGPAGTGKTESTKDLAKALARQCVVFNCSDQIDYKMMGKLYSGVVTAGAWTCLDEFNRISIEVLSVIAQQLLTIRVALLNDQQEFMFEGFMLQLKRWRPFACTWLYNHLPEGAPYTSGVRSKIWDLMERHLDPAIAWIRRNSTEPVTTVDPQLVYSFCHLFEAILSWEASTRHGAASSDCDTEKNPMVDLRKLNPSDEESAKLLDKIIQGAFCFAMAWSIGGSCDTKSRQLFAQYCEQEFESISFPRGGSVYDGYVDLNKGSRFLPWEDLVPKFSYKETDSYLQLLVPNVDSVRFSYVVDKMLTQQKSVFLTGMTGVGKSVILGNLLEKMKVHSKVVPVAMTLSAQSNASRIQLTIEGKLEKKRKTLLGAPVNKTIVILVDDVNMPAVEEYGAQPPIELLRLMQDLGGFYDRKKLFWKDVENTTLLLCAAPPGGGRNEMTPRFTRHSMVLCMPNTSNDAMSVIFSSIVNGFFTTYKFKPDVQALVNSMVGGTIEFYEKISSDLLPTPAKSHYLFNLRDVSKVFQGVLMARPASCNSADKGVKLWIHEMSRVFYDRLINEEDRKWYVDTLMKLVKVKFRADNLQASDVFGDTPLMWGDFLRPGSDNKVYEEIADLAKMARILEDFNDDMAEMGEFEIELTKGYGVDQFREDEKAFLMGAGSAEGKQTLFLLNDTQIISETFLEDINNVLNAGEVPNLFPSDEMDRIIGDLRPVAKENNRSEAKDAVWNYFIERSVLRWSEVFLERLRRHVYSTPKSYLDLIHLYTEMLSEKRDEKMRVQKRLVVGLDKLREANSVVSSLQEELTALQPILAQKKVETDELIIVVTEERKKADEVAAKVASEEAVVREQAETVQAIQADAQKDLDVAMPALEKAIKSLDALDKKDITEIKSFPKPPALVMMTMEAVNTLLGEKPDWDTAKRVLSDSQFMTKLKEYDKDNIPQSVLKKLEKYIVKPEYAPDSVGNQSKAAKSLCKQNDLKAIQDKVAALKQKLDDTEAEKDRLIKEAELTQARLQRAEVLTVGLAGESVRWKETVEKMDAEIEALTGDVFLSAAAISYFGPFTGQYRREVVGEWLSNMQQLGIPCSEAFSLVGVMGNPVQVREWNLQGLPSDSVSLDNGVLVTRGKRWPLMIDPQEQANKWIKKKEGGGGSTGQLQLLKLGNPKLLLIVENAIRMGNPLLIEDIGETLDPSLEPVLQKAVFNNNGRLQIHLGDSDVDYNPDFRFYMTTKLPNPHYYPEVCIKVTVINFTVTFEGLGEQLLTLVVESELPEVMRRKTELMMQLDKDKKTLQGLEDEILRLLSESQGNILDDEVLISTLQQSKVTAKEIEERVADAEVTKVEIEAACNKYLSVSERGSILYFVVADLANIDPMYQFSLFYFVRMFMYTIHNAEKSDDLDTRLKTLITDITEYVFKLVCRGLFEVHKLIFSFLIQTQIDRHAGHIQNAEWGLLLRGVGIQDVSGRPNNPDVDLIPEKQWQLLFAVQQLVPQLGDICSHINKNIDPWRRWCCEEEPHLVDLPENYEKTRPAPKKAGKGGDEQKGEKKAAAAAAVAAELSYFRKLLILKCLCPEKVLFGVGEYVKRTLGEKYCVFATPMMEEVFADSSHTTPIIFVLSTGADPTQMLLRFAHAEDYESKLHIISLGQGQGPRAQKLMERGYEEGLWVLLQNCHLAKSWMPTLQRLVEAMEGNALISHQFRLFLTSMPADYFPVPILQISVKLTTEPPKGLKANVKRSLISLDDDTLNKSRKAPAWRRLQFSLKLFHAVIQERRKFGPLGWNIRYEFNDSDLETSTVILHNMLELEDAEIPWDTITFVVGQINYGGRVTDDWDRRCLMATLGRFVNPDIMEKDNYSFSASGVYRLPDGVDEIAVSSFRQYVDSLPLSEAPEIFGMHDNANISFQQQESDVILNTVLSIQPRESGGGGGRSADEIVYELATQMLERLPAPITEESACKEVFAVNEQGMMGSLGTCLSQEMSRFNKLIGRMKKTLTELQKAIKGLIVMTADLDAMFSALQNNYIPSLWEAVAYPSLKPLASWFEDMISRVEFFRDWVINDQPVAYWISAFYFPQGFLTAVLQAYSRFYMVPVDVLGFEFIVQDFDDPLNEVDEPPTEGCLVYGLYMDGCRWDYEDMVLEDQDPGVMYVNAPTIHFVPCKNYKVDPDQYSCPLYKTSVRAGTLSTTGHSTNFVLAIDMDTNKPKDHWVLRGAALLTMLND